jgi:hypothetical protein
LKKVLIISLFLSANLCIAFAQNERFKSLYVFNFVKNIEWPAAYKEGNFTVTVLGSSLIYNELKENIQGKQIGSQVIDVNQVSNISGLKSCHILYISMQQCNLLGVAKQALAGNPTVCITET